ncbi:MAG: ribonuclease [Gammaproteobacteria bacterium]|nr:ribonuclease [Gammaproteobacteria bacterium]
MKVVFVSLLLVFHSVASADNFKAGDFDYYILSLSWQSAFCEMNQQKPECQKQAVGDYSATNFSLHGLWPNRRGDKKHRYAYCGVEASAVRLDKKGRWCDQKDIYAETELAEKMPGVQSCLQMHEWVKHGSCSGMSIDKYFNISLDLMDDVSSTRLATLVRMNVGRTISRSELLTAWEKEFPLSRDSLTLRCRKINNQSYLTEIRVALKKKIGASLSSALLNKPEIRSNCARHITIDEVGFR